MDTIKKEYDYYSYCTVLRVPRSASATLVSAFKQRFATLSALNLSRDVLMRIPTGLLEK